MGHQRELSLGDDFLGVLIVLRVQDLLHRLNHLCTRRDGSICEPVMWSFTLQRINGFQSNMIAPLFLLLMPRIAYLFKVAATETQGAVQ